MLPFWFFFFQLTKDYHWDNYKFMIWAHSQNTLLALPHQKDWLQSSEF